MLDQIIITSRMAIWSLAETYTDPRWERQAEAQLLEDDFTANWALISINGSDEKKLPPFGHNLLRAKGCTSYCELVFDDINGRIWDKLIKENRIDPSKYNLFSIENAKEILKFIEVNEFTRLIVHCHAGISRSSAVACFIAERSGIKSNIIFGVHHHIEPNPYVVQMLYRTAGIPYSNFIKWIDATEFNTSEIDYSFPLIEDLVF